MASILEKHDLKYLSYHSTRSKNCSKKLIIILFASMENLRWLIFVNDIRMNSFFSKKKNNLKQKLTKNCLSFSETQFIAMQFMDSK